MPSSLQFRVIPPEIFSAFDDVTIFYQYEGGERGCGRGKGTRERVLGSGDGEV